MNERESGLRRISLLIREDQHRRVQELGLNLSGLFRDMLDDRLSERKITFAVSSETRSYYDQLVSNFGATDDQLEPIFRELLAHFLSAKIEEMKKIRDDLLNGTSGQKK